ncbi:MAG: hypothetical protein ABL982_19710 [Vicinamibacterales bacterium]
MTINPKHLAVLVVLAVGGWYGYAAYQHVQRDHASFHVMIRWVNEADKLIAPLRTPPASAPASPKE